ncbi:MAG TPA: hypothetical protein VK781_00110 [Solirubrobacteraceae bacterium]|nr:hypothetical protein [Solirubrobacteraceae bacterium]
MFSWIRKRATYANVAMTLALVFAMTGGAYAAKKYLITSTKQISPGVLKSLQGKAGAAGVAGPSGPVGSQGSAGPRGETGAAGTEGAPGENGKDGVSVTSAEVLKSSTTCSKQGGSEFTSASGKTTACNGKEGSPWTAGGILPSGKTETGAWSFGFSSAGGAYYVPIAFTIPLSTALLGESHVHFIDASGEEVVGANIKKTSTQCVGTAAAPTAESGNLCIYTAYQSGFTATSAEIYGAGTEAEIGVSTAGSVMTTAASAGSLGFGTWAVTAE